MDSESEYAVWLRRKWTFAGKLDIRKLLSALLISLEFSEYATNPCEKGQSRYVSRGRKTCKKCRCRKGFGKVISAPIDFDPVQGALNCYPCQRCPSGKFSNKNTDYKCVYCAPECSKLNRKTLKKCNGRRNVQCGGCLKGYYLTNYVDFRNFSCERCTNETKHISDCDFDISSPITNLATSAPVLTTTSLHAGNTQPHSLPGFIIFFMTVLVLLVLAIICCFPFVILYVVCRRKSRHDNVENKLLSTQSSIYSYQKEQRDMNQAPQDTDIQEDGGDTDTNNVTSSNEERIDKEENAGKAYDQMRKLTNGIGLRKNKLHLQRAANLVDRNPMLLYKALGIKNSIIYQMKGDNPDDRSPDTVYNVLNRWVNSSENDPTVETLCRALYDNGYIEAYEGIMREFTGDKL